jgi:hypothetical protein
MTKGYIQTPIFALRLTMAGRRDDDYMDADSDSGGSFIVDDREVEKGAGRGGKAKTKRASRRKEKGKRKAKEVCVARNITSTRIYKVAMVATIFLGGILYPLMGCRARGRRWKLAACC